MPQPKREDPALREAAETHAKAIDEFTSGLAKLWKSHLDLAVRTGDKEALRRTLQGGETGLWDTNTNCPCGGGGTAHW